MNSNLGNSCRVKKSLSEGALRPSDLLAHFKQIQPTTRTQIRAAELLDNTVELIREMVYTHTMAQPSPHGNQSSTTTSTCSDPKKTFPCLTTSAVAFTDRRL